MKANRQIKFGAILSYLSMAVGYIVQILYTPLMIRMIGQSQYGVYNLTNSIINYLTIFSVGFSPAYVRFFMRHKVKDDDRGIVKLNGLFMTIFLILAVVVIIAGVFIVKNTHLLIGNKFTAGEIKLASILMALMILNLAISFPLIPVVSYIQANERFIFQNGLNIVRQVFNPLLSLPLLFLGYGAIGMTLVTTTISIAISIWQFIFAYTRLNFRLTFHDLDFSEFKEVAVFSTYIFLNAVTDQINWNADKFIVGRYSGAVAVGVYGIAAQLNSYYLGFSTAISNVFIPRINNVVANQKADSQSELNNIFQSIGRIQLIIVGAVLINIIVIGKQFIIFWAGKPYSGAYELLVVLVIPVTIPLIQNTGIAIQQAMNKHVFRSVVYFLIALVNIFASILLVGKVGSIGAASATAGSLILGNGFLMNWYYQKHIGLNVVEFWKAMQSPFVNIVIACVFGTISRSFIDVTKVTGFLLVAVITTSVYTALTWIFTLSKTQRNMMVDRLNRLGR